MDQNSLMVNGMWKGYVYVCRHVEQAFGIFQEHLSPMCEAILLGVFKCSGGKDLSITKSRHERVIYFSVSCISAFSSCQEKRFCFDTTML